MNDVIAWAQIIATLAVVATFLIYWALWRTTQQQLKTAQEASRTQNLLSLIDYIHHPEHRTARYVLINNKDKPLSQWTPEERTKAERACSCWDTVALIVRNTQIDGATELVVAHWRHSIRSCYSAAAELMDELRQHRDVDFWDDFEWLGKKAIFEAEVLSKRSAAQQVVSADAASRRG